MHSLWQKIPGTLHAQHVRYCVLRGGAPAQYAALEAERVEVDLLVAPDQIGQATRLLTDLGFLPLRSWGYAPHRFFVGFDADTGRWLKLDLVTRVALGRPIHALDTSLAASCLEHRRACGEAFIPSAQDELAALILHCVVDKGKFAARHRERLQALRGEIDDASRLDQHLSDYWPHPLNWTGLSAMIDEGNWDALLEQRNAVVRHLAARQRWQTAGRALRDRSLRRVHRLLRLLRPQAVSVALLAPDGAGKSTLAKRLGDEFYFPARVVYMGLYGRKPERRRFPGLGVLGKVLKQQARFLWARCNQARGRLVIFDRYTYDALLPSQRPAGVLNRMRRWLLAHACPAPDLVVVLDAPGSVLFGRKGEHSIEILEAQRQGYLGLARHVRNLVVVDATQAGDRVHATVTASIWQRYLDRSRRGGRP